MACCVTKAGLYTNGALAAQVVHFLSKVHQNKGSVSPIFQLHCNKRQFYRFKSLSITAKPNSKQQISVFEQTKTTIFYLLDGFLY